MAPLNIYVTVGGCNRGCRHCLTDITTGLNNFSTENAEKLARSICVFYPKYENFLVQINNGEPLMNEHIGEIVKILLEADPKISVSIVTSGFLKNCEEERKRLGQVAALWDKYNDQERWRLNLALSFNDFNSTFPERLETTLLFLFDETPIKRVTVKVTFAFDDKNIQRTFSKLEIIMQKIGYDGPCWLHYEKVPVAWLTELFSTKVYSQKMYQELKEQAMLADCFYSARTEDGKVNTVLVKPQPIIPFGRASSLFKSEDFKSYPYRSFLLHCDITDKNHLSLDENGFWYSGSDCPKESVFQLGSLNNNLSEILAKKRECARIAIPYLLSPRDEEIRDCNICQQVWGAL